jgi:hypothetical protein
MAKKNDGASVHECPHQVLLSSRIVSRGFGAQGKGDTHPSQQI